MTGFRFFIFSVTIIIVRGSIVDPPPSLICGKPGLQLLDISENILRAVAIGLINKP